jgi:hypothetical protein
MLKAAYEDARNENERLRDARATVTRQLGPLPISAGVVAGLVAAFDTDSIQSEGLLWAALAVFVLFLVPLSMIYSRLPPYRELRKTREEALNEQERPSKVAAAVLQRPPPEATPLLTQWYRSMLRLETEVNADLVKHFERERRGLLYVQGLFALVIVLLVLSRIA